MIWTAWNNGAHHDTGAGYGFKIAVADRNRYFERHWDTIIVELPQKRDAPLAVEANIAKNSFWSEECGEVVHQDIGRWLRDHNYAPWESNRPPRFLVEPAEDAQRFIVRQRVR